MYIFKNIGGGVTSMSCQDSGIARSNNAKILVLIEEKNGETEFWGPLLIRSEIKILK